MIDQVKSYLNLSGAEAFNHPLFYYGLLAVFVLIFCWWLTRRLRTELVSVFTDEEGAVQITPRALRELVRKSCIAIPGVHSPKTKIIRKGGNLRLHVSLRVEQDCKVKETRSHLKEKLEGIMVNNLNFDNFTGVDLVISGFQDQN